MLSLKRKSIHFKLAGVFTPTPKILVWGVTLFFLLITTPVLPGQAVAQPESSEKEKPALNQEETTEDPGRVVVRVNGVDITEGELGPEVASMIPRITAHSSVKEETVEKMRKKAMEKLIMEELKTQEARVRGIKVTKKRIKEGIEQLKTRFPEGRTLEDYLEIKGKDIEWLRGIIERGLLIERLNTRMTKGLRKDTDSIVTEEFIRRYYEENRRNFVVPERARVREILFKVDPGNIPGWEVAKKKAQEIIERLENGEDFAALAREFSMDEYAEKGGDMGFVHKGSLIAGLNEPVEHLAEGEVGGPIWTLYGYHVIKVEERSPAVQKEYVAVKERLMWDLKSREYKRLFAKWLKGLKEKARIEYLSK